MYYPPKDLSYEDFPNDEFVSDGMNVLNANHKALQCKYLKDIIYTKRDNIDLSIQMLIPYRDERNDDKYPLIVYIQGSAWSKQDVYFNLPALSDMAKRGYVVASVEYRPSDIRAFPAQIQDVKTAIRFLIMNANQYCIDPNQVFIWGDSSGGHTAVMVGITVTLDELDTQEYKDYSCKVNGIIDFYGPTDISKMNEVPSIMDHIKPESPEGRLIGKKNVINHPELVRKTSPMTYINKESQIPPIIIFHGSKDRLVSFRQSVLLYNKLMEESKEVSFYKINGADHGGATLWTKEVLDIVEAFIKNILFVKNN
jgi:acetyl esterase/lipase